MEKVKSSLEKKHIIRIIIAIILMATSLWGVVSLEKELEADSARLDNVPLYYIRPEGQEEIPGVIVAHGFGGSKQMMFGYGYALARAGYGVVLLDFAGHAANPQPMNSSRDNLQQSLDAAYRFLTAQPEIIPDQIALVGHSMGSGAVMQAGINLPGRYTAVIALSPTGANVSKSLPPNLMLQAGSLEGHFVENAQELLAEAGGESDAFQEKMARTFVEIPNVEHITILFNTFSQAQAIDWLNHSFGVEFPTETKDSRMAWYGLHLVSWLILVAAAGPLIKAKADIFPAQPDIGRRWLFLLASPLIATGILMLCGCFTEINGFLGLQVGGALAVWFLVMGCGWLFGGGHITSPRWHGVFWGLLFFGILWTAMGLMAQFTWMQWFLIPKRLLLWPLLALTCLPWKLAAGVFLQGLNNWKRAGFWLLQSVLVVGVLALTASLVPGMYVIILIAPVLPFIFGIETLLGKRFEDPWAYGIGSALFVGWMIASFFPLI